MVLYLLLHCYYCNHRLDAVISIHISFLDFNTSSLPGTYYSCLISIDIFCFIVFAFCFVFVYNISAQPSFAMRILLWIFRGRAKGETGIGQRRNRNISPLSGLPAQIFILVSFSTPSRNNIFTINFISFTL